MEGILNKEGEIISLQVSKMGNIPGGNFNLQGKYFLIKNNTEDNIRVTIKPASNDDYIETMLAPGWNTELVKEIKNAPSNTLQYGY